MLKKFLLAIGVLAATTGIAVANTAPYVGAGLGIITNTSHHLAYTRNVHGSSWVKSKPGNFRGVPFNVFAGYGGVIDQNFYVAGEIFGTIATAEISDNHGLKTSWGYGASIIPGIMLSDHTLAFARVGVVDTHFSDASKTRVGGQLGLGLQTAATQNIDVRGEYTYTGYRSFDNHAGDIASPRSDAFNVALVYKFD